METTLTVHVPSPIGKCADSSATHWSLANVPVLPNPDKPGELFLVATNSQILAVVPTSGDANGAHVMPGAMAIPKKPTTKAPYTVTANGEYRDNSGRVLPVPECQRYPQVSSVVRDVSEEGTIPLKIDVELLVSLAEAIATRGGGVRFVTLLIPTGSDVVTGAIPVIGDLGYGVLMPARPQNKKESNSACRDRIHGLWTTFKGAFVSAARHFGM